MLSYGKKIVVCVYQIFLQKSNMKLIVSEQLKFLLNKSTQTKNF